MAVFKRFDHDRSGTMEVTELESALDQYFDEVAAEFDELREDDVGRSQPRVVTGPSPPTLRKCGDDENLKVLLEWASEYKGRRLELQGMKVASASKPPPPQTPSRGIRSSFKSMKELMSDEWKSVYNGTAPSVEISLSDPSALFIFRLATCMNNEDQILENESGQKFIQEYSAEVFWIGRPEPPVLCGIGCNLLASWTYPAIPAQLHSLRPPVPVWKIHVRKCIHPDHIAQVKASLEKEDDEGDWVVTQAPLGSASCVVNGLKCVGGVLGNVLNRYEVCLSCELPSGHSSLSVPIVYSSTLPCPTIVEENDNGELSPRQEVSHALTLNMPQPLDPHECLFDAGVRTFYSTEGLDSNGEWQIIYEGSESTVVVHGLPLDTVSLIRVNCSLDLRSCSRYGIGPIEVTAHQATGSSISSNRPRYVGGSLMPAFGCREGVAYEDGTWPGASRARSLKYNGLLSHVSPQPHVSWDVGTATTVCLPPSPPMFDGDAFDFSVTLNASDNANAHERLSILWNKPRGVIPESKKDELKKKGTSLGLMGALNGKHGKSGKLSKEMAALCGPLEAEYVCELFDVESEVWRRVYRGSDIGCHLSSFDMSPDGSPTPFTKLLSDPTNCFLFRYGRKFLNANKPPPAKRRHSFVAEKRSDAYGMRSPNRARSAGAARPTPTDSPSPTDRNVGWSFSRPIIAVLSPPPPVCSWADELKRGVMVKWGIDLDTSKLPAGWKVKPQRYALEV
jgi:hypothetical protein